MKERIKPVFKCPEEFKPVFPLSKCLLTISVGQEVHEGEKFLTTINLVNKTFKEAIILVDDTLQRHTMALETDLSLDMLYQISFIKGTEWLERNKKLYSCLSIPYTIIRWNHWLHHENYNRQYNIIQDHYFNDEGYRGCFEIAIKQFLSRYLTRLKIKSLVSYDHRYSLCLNYLLEECTAMCLWVEENINFEVYPSPRNPAMTATHSIFIRDKYPHLLLPVAIKFKNRKQFVPQDLSI